LQIPTLYIFIAFATCIGHLVELCASAAPREKEQWKSVLSVFC